MNYLKMAATLVVAATMSQAYGSPLAFGHFIVVKSQTGHLIAAPHGGFDLNTDHLTLRLIRRLGWSGVTATGFRQRTHLINVNRPTEGVGLSPEQERHTENAQIVFDEFIKKLDEASQGDVQFYVEIHGMSRIADEIQIATVGVAPSEAERIKKIFRLKLRELFLAQKYQPMIEGVDQIHFTAAATKKFGSLKSVSRALHIELPWGLRMQDMDKSVELLADVLPKIARLFDTKCAQQLGDVPPLKRLTPIWFEGEN